jgi:hypothetical protein
MNNDRAVLSVGPEELDYASGTDWNVELKLDWEDIERDGMLQESEDLRTLVEDAGVDQEQVVDVHLPPGTSSSNPGMSATQENIGAMTDFSFRQLAEMPDVFMTTHPPKDFRYLDQLWVLNDLLDSVDHEISIENTSDPSKWYTPEAIAFFGFVGDQYPESFEDLYLTIDSAHLPQGEYIHQDFDEFYEPESEEVRELMDEADVDQDWLFEIDYDRVSDIIHEINDDLQTRDEQFPVQFITYMGENFRDTIHEYLPGEDGLIRDDELTGDRYLPLLQTIAMTGGRVRSIHLNDPVSNDVPTREDYDESNALQKSLEYVNDSDAYVVLEPEDDFSRREAGEYMERASEMLEETR